MIGLKQELMRAFESRTTAELSDRATHDVRDRRRTNMETACQALANCVADLCAFASEPTILPGVAYSVADRLGRIIAELEGFHARDLISMRTIEVDA